MAERVATHSLSPGVRLGEFTIVRPLAVGGMAELYLAVPTEGERQAVALKRMLPHLAWDPEFVRMFLDEVRIVAALDHPNIVRVLDFGIGDGSHFFAMEYVHGYTVLQLLQNWEGSDPLPLPVAISIVEGVARGLEYAHDPEPGRSGLVHRDVSPSNIMVSFEGDVKLLDFGIARLSQETQKTRAGTLKGKVGYMSPEQCRGGPLDRRSDVFGLGVLLYELSLRRRAFFGDNDFAVMNQIVLGTFEPPREVMPDFPEPLDSLIRDAMSVDPAARPPTAGAFLTRLCAWADGEGVDRSSDGLAAFLADSYGKSAPPSLEVPEVKFEPERVPEPPVAPKRRWPLAAAVLVGATGFSLAGYVLGRTPSPSDTESVSSEEPKSRTAEVVPAASVPDAEPEADAPIQPSAKPEEAAVPVGAEPVAPKRRGKRKRKRRGKSRASESSTATRPGSSVLPPSWQGEAGRQ